ncbi:MAG: ABC transporter substrate-binding protein/permease [Mycobacteriaceae bacterium]|nr:ABC transporter substrate-binding protein/permease [Mycobacteriaceae bacterium]
MVVVMLLTCGLVSAAPVVADPDQCAPPGMEHATALPKKLLASTSPNNASEEHTTATVSPLASVDIAGLGLSQPGVLTVATLSDSPPNVCINSAGQFTGFDNELLRAIANKLGLQVNFIGIDFSGLLAQVGAQRFDVGSASIMVTDERRRTVNFTNGYDFGYLALVVPAGSRITGIHDLTAGQRIGAVQGTIENAYVINTLRMQPVQFPDNNTVYANLKTGQIDAWVAPGSTAMKLIRPDDPAAIVDTAWSPGVFTAYAVSNRNQWLVDALNSGLDAVIADGTWSRLYTDWVPRPLPPDWKPGSRAAPIPHLPDFTMIAARHHQPTTLPVPKSTLAQLRQTFLDVELYKRAIPDLLMIGLPNTLLLTAGASVIGLILGMGLAIAGISRRRWLCWPARIYTDVFRGLPEVVIILLIGLGVGPVLGGLTGNNPYPLGIAALGLTAAAYIGEIFRSGIQSVDAGQLEAARALGFSYSAAMRLVVVPQGIRRVLPALVNQCIALLKASALVYFLGLIAGQRELFQVGRDLNAQTGNLSPLVAAGVFYLMLTVPLTHLVNFIDARLNRNQAGGVPERPLGLISSTYGSELT